MITLHRNVSFDCWHFRPWTGKHNVQHREIYGQPMDTRQVVGQN